MKISFEISRHAAVLYLIELVQFENCARVFMHGVGGDLKVEGDEEEKQITYQGDAQMV